MKLIEHKTYYGHEVPLGYLMGICGSAFSSDVYNILLELYQLMYPGPIDPSKQEPLEHILSFLQTVLEDGLGKLGEKLTKGKLSTAEITTYLNNHEIAAARLANPTYGSTTSVLHSLKEITLVEITYG